MERQYLDRGYATTLAVCTCGFRELVPNVARGWAVLAIHAATHGDSALPSRNLRRHTRGVE